MELGELAGYLDVEQSKVSKLRVVTGFDGFVDEMISLVDERQDLEHFRRVEEISRFGDLVKQAAGHSSLREIVVTAMHPGGCAVNMGDGLASLGVEVDTFATLGDPVHAAFADYGKIAKLHSWGREPGRTLAFEFADGKLMFSAVTQLADFHPDAVTEYLADQSFTNACQSAQLIALTDWTLYPHMTGVWNLLAEDVFLHLKGRPWLFIDLVDPSSRSLGDIKEMLKSMQAFIATTRVALGLNQNEANIIARLTNVFLPDTLDKLSSLRQAMAIRDYLGLEQVIIHAHAYAVCAGHDGEYAVDGPYCAKPVKSTGAGDRFNAGYALGLMLNLPPEGCLRTAVACSGFFVRNARSASLPELVGFLKSWDRKELD